MCRGREEGAIDEQKEGPQKVRRTPWEVGATAGVALTMFWLDGNHY
jgi:hypothetical protein